MLLVPCYATYKLLLTGYCLQVVTYKCTGVQHANNFDRVGQFSSSKCPKSLKGKSPIQPLLNNVQGVCSDNITDKPIGRFLQLTRQFVFLNYSK